MNMTARRRLGSTELEVFPMCLGGGVFAWTADKAQSFDVLDAYADHGGNFVDTADAYGSWVPGNPPGASELIIGEWLAARRNRADMVIATKVGQMPNHQGLSAQNIKDCARESMRRLGVDHIDLYYAHEDDPSVELEETLTAFDDLVRAGWVRYVAASNYSAERLSEALTTSDRLGLTSYVGLQTHYNLVARDRYEDSLRDVCAAGGLVCLPYHSVANGFLTGKYRDGSGTVESVRVDAVRPYQNEAGFAVLATLDRIAQEQATTPGAVALAWLNAQPTVGVPVASARTPQQLGELLDVARVELTAPDLAALDEASNRITSQSA